MNSDGLDQNVTAENSHFCAIVELWTAASGRTYGFFVCERGNSGVDYTLMKVHFLPALFFQGVFPCATIPE
jgi:hypothetical protein